MYMLLTEHVWAILGEYHRSVFFCTELTALYCQVPRPISPSMGLINNKTLQLANFTLQLLKLSVV